MELTRLTAAGSDVVLLKRNFPFNLFIDIVPKAKSAKLEPKPDIVLYAINLIQF